MFDGLRVRRRPPFSSWMRVLILGFKVLGLGFYGRRGGVELELRLVVVRLVVCAVLRTLLAAVRQIFRVGVCVLGPAAGVASVPLTGREARAGIAGVMRWSRECNARDCLRVC